MKTWLSTPGDESVVVGLPERNPSRIAEARSLTPMPELVFFALGLRVNFRNSKGASSEAMSCGERAPGAVHAR